MKKYEFVDLEIDSTKYPFNTHLFWEHSTYGIFMVDGTDQTVLLHSTIARLLIDGSDWDIVDLSDNTNSYKIQSGYLDGNDLWLIMCDNDGTADDYEVCYIEFDDSNDCNPVGVSTLGDINTIYAYDIIKMGDGNFYSLSRNLRSGGLPFSDIDIVTTAPFVHKSHFNNALDDMSFAVATGSTTFIHTQHNTDFDIILVYEYDTGTENLTILSINLPRPTNYTLPPRSQTALAYNDLNIIYFVAQKDSDSKFYLWTYNISEDEFVEVGEYNVALMLDRNNNKTSPTELEKAFGLVDKNVYELKPIGGTISKFQDMSVLLATDIIGITDNYLIADDTGGGAYPMFELQDVSESEISVCDIDYLMGNVTTCEFISTDNLQNLTSIKFYDNSDVLTFFGNIIEKQYNDLNSYFYRSIGYDNEINTYKFSLDETAGNRDAKVIIEEVLDSSSWLHYGPTLEQHYILNFYKFIFRNIISP